MFFYLSFFCFFSLTYSNNYIDITQTGNENDSLSKIEVMNINYSKGGKKKESVLNETQKFYRTSIRRERRVKELNANSRSC